MKVKLLVPICGPDGSFKAGDTPDLPDVLAKALVKDGHAETIEITQEIESVEEVKPEEVSPEEPTKNKSKRR